MRALSRCGIQVWWSPADTAPDDAARWLVADEQARAGRFHFDGDRHAYITAHAMLRLLLERHGSAHARAPLQAGVHGKPWLPGGIEFNLSHTRGMVACALSLSPVGVDVESASRAGDWRSLVPQVLSDHERAVLHALPPQRQQAQFYAAWTGKEAWAKATGLGLHADFRALDVLRPPTGLFLAAVDTAPGFQAAVCSTVGVSQVQVSEFVWTDTGWGRLEA